jgi:hypothetical protein
VLCFDPSWPNLVPTPGGLVGPFEGLVEFVGEGVGGGDAGA